MSCPVSSVKSLNQGGETVTFVPMAEVTEDCHPKIFISYSHDNDALMDRVLGLAERLRKDGFETLIDRYAGAPSEGWPRWMLNGIEWADFVLVVCTETYYHRFRGRDAPHTGLGVDWEGAVITNELYDQKSVSGRFIPVLFDEGDTRYVPEPLRAFNYYVLKSEGAYEALVDYLAGAAGIRPAQLGPPPARKQKVGTPLEFDKVAPTEDVVTPPGAHPRSRSAEPQAATWQEETSLPIPTLLSYFSVLF